MTKPATAKPAAKPAEAAAPAFDLGSLTVTDAAPIVVTRKREPRKLSPLAAHLSDSRKNSTNGIGSAKAVTLPSDSAVKAAVAAIRGDAKQLGFGVKVQVVGRTVKFAARDARSRAPKTS